MKKLCWEWKIQGLIIKQKEVKKEEEDIFSIKKVFDWLKKFCNGRFFAFVLVSFSSLIGDAISRIVTDSW